MTSLGNPKVWVPYMNNKDCSQGFCSFYCPQWCYVIYPPPPPPFEFPKDNSSPNFSPLVIAIIGVFASAFLLVTYYTLISKYCGQRQSSQSQQTLHEANIAALEENQNPSLHQEPWHVSNTGLDEALIKSITVCKYKKGDGLVELTDCSVCLSEFQDDESVRLLPKCNHAFHLPCIDTWLKSHSSCPLCRASIFTFNAAATTTSVSANLPVIEIPSRNEVSLENHQHFDDHVDDELDGVEEVEKTELRALSDLGNLRGRHGVIEIREIQRSVSMDHCFESGLLIADVLHMNEEEKEIDSHVEGEECSSSGVGSSKRSRGESSSSKSSYRRKVLHCVLSPISMKRSFSSGRIGRGRQGVLPI